MGKQSFEMKRQKARATQRQATRAREQMERDRQGGRDFVLSLPPGSAVVNFGCGPLGNLRLAYGPDGEELSREVLS